MLNIELLEKTTQIPGAPGYEHKIRSFIQSEIESHVDEIYTDAMGNLIAVQKGTSDKKMMIAAHMDEISFIVSHIDEDGFIKFQTLGGFDAKTLTAQRIILHGKKDIIGVMGTKPIHIMTAEELSKPPKIQDYFIDTGLSKEELLKYISIGTPITRERGFIEMGNAVNSKSIDNRICVFLLMETMKELKGQDLPMDVYAVFTVQEEVGLRGATAATMGIDPDFAINLDVTLACDVPGSASHERITDLGKGAAIKVLDGRTICDYRMVDFMKATAEKNNIKYQLEVLPKGGTDTASMQQYAKGGSIAGGISIPCRYLHQVIEMADKRDVRGAIDLLKACLIGMKDYNWDHK
ncbi:MAG: M42 family metallopeptidase [Saprospiraceae bacterium]|nr:M42 family metallopeptidase [Bacteroidia bacterium]NNE13374.1 M42 family metallopeptidase [Saprospiraceae bacterium]NNL91077.1 M42 family metallopeptidase [Saprospiraceae bacterium]